MIVTPILDTEDGTFGARSIPFYRSCVRKTTLVIGPGLSQHSEMQGVVEELLQAWSGPAVIDADGLNVLNLTFFEKFL